MSTANKFAPHYTVEDYFLWKGDWELWDGIAIAMSPSPFGQHQAIAVALVSEIRNALRSNACSATALMELDWIVTDDTVVRPDIMIVCGPPPEKHQESAPELIAEVLSPSTRENDLTYKRELYAQQGVGTYVIVDPEDRRIQRLTLSDSGEYHERDATEKLEMTICTDCMIAVDAKSVFAS